MTTMPSTYPYPPPPPSTERKGEEKGIVERAKRAKGDMGRNGVKKEGAGEG